MLFFPLFPGWTLQTRWAGDGPWERPVSVAVVGDMGLVNAGATFDRLHQLVEDNEVDFVLHLGDIGCELVASALPVKRRDALRFSLSAI